MDNTQRKAVMTHLQEKGSITSMEAFQLYGVTRLSSIIHTFRKQGILIGTIMIDGKTRYGSSCKYAKYILAKEEEK